jgi:nicotinamidase-related amidase
MIVGTGEVQPPPALQPQHDEPVFVRTRSSAFAGSDLAEFVRAREVTTLALVGVATSGVVLATACAADDLDLETYVLADGVADPEPRVQEVLLAHVLPQFARVLDSADLFTAAAQ